MKVQGEIKSQIMKQVLFKMQMDFLFQTLKVFVEWFNSEFSLHLRG